MMSKKQLNLTYALKDDKIINISDVESGLKCGCICPSCGEPLVAKKGSKMMHHFSHHSGHNCEYGYETSLHLAAKDIISKTKKIVIPAVYLNFPDSYKKDELICESKEIQVDKVELEKRYGDIIPDIVLYVGGKLLFVEIYVTHRIDEEKLKKLQKAKISTLEIDLSQKKETITERELTDLLLNDSEEKTWKYNAVAQKQLHRFYEVSDIRTIIMRGYTMHVDNCPLKTRSWKGKPYANVIDDCLYCDYCISSNLEEGILCSGRTRIAALGDFNKPEKERIKDSDDILDSLRSTAFASGTCPNCGGALVERHGKYGDFWGCRNYPHCRFIASCDPETGEIIMKS